jgi:RecA/RadA recombinase
MSDFLKNIIKEVGNEYASLVEDGVEAGDVDSFIDTGSYIFNALLSGSLYGGLPSNKITALAGESATGKTYFLMGIVKNFLDKDPEAGVIYFESESALTKQLIVDRGIDPKRMVLMPVTTVQEFRHDALKTLDSYIAQNEADRRPLFLCLDSLGMLSTTKEVEDTAEGKETRDMTRAQVLKAAFRVLTLKLGRAKVPMVVTNHTYDVIGSMFPQKEMGGGSGLKYAASSIIYLSRRKEKVGTEIVGNIIHCKNHKSRLTVENRMVDIRLTYDKGLDRYYGLLELAEKYGVFKKVSTRYELPDGSKQFGKTIMNDPKTYFTEEIMAKLEECAAKEYRYAATN